MVRVDLLQLVEEGALQVRLVELRHGHVLVHGLQRGRVMKVLHLLEAS